MASTLVSFPIKDGKDVTIVTLNPSNNANGVAEFSNTDVAQSQRYIVTASVRGGNNTRKYTVKMQVPKVDTQVVNGVQLPVTAWRAYISFDVTVPVFASPADVQLIIDTYVSALARTSPVSQAISGGVGFY
jgi:hypothetical protein